MEQLSKLWPILGPIVGTILGALVAWLLNQRAKWKWERHIRKEERYVRFLDSITGFYVDSASAPSRTEFLRQLRLAWLSCPDEVIHLGNRFLETVETKDEKSADDEKEAALGSLVLEMRRDMVGTTKTCLKAADFKHWKSEQDALKS